MEALVVLIFIFSVMFIFLLLTKKELKKKLNSMAESEFDETTAWQNVLSQNKQDIISSISSVEKSHLNSVNSIVGNQGIILDNQKKLFKQVDDLINHQVEILEAMRKSTQLIVGNQKVIQENQILVGEAINKIQDRLNKEFNSAEKKSIDKKKLAPLVKKKSVTKKTSRPSKNNSKK